jgi:hypothetical protein
MDFPGIALRRSPATTSPASERKQRRSAPTALLAWWSQSRLDRELAAGADPAADPKLAYRARRLTSARVRRQISGSIECVLEEAEAGWHGMSSATPVTRRSTQGARLALRALADALVADGPMRPQGVALASLLVTDASGPLYTATESRALTLTAVTAVNALRDGSAFLS